jgi:hypothetical protein
VRELVRGVSTTARVLSVLHTVGTLGAAACAGGHPLAGTQEGRRHVSE